MTRPHEHMAYAISYRTMLSIAKDTARIQKSELIAEASYMLVAEADRVLKSRSLLYIRAVQRPAASS
jgi:hypothetical protein